MLTVYLIYLKKSIGRFHKVFAAKTVLFVKTDVRR